MKYIIRFRWLIAVIWIATAVSLFVFAPNLQELVREKGQIAAPEDSPSVEAQQLIESMSSGQSGNQTSSVLVFHEEDGFDQQEKDEVIKAISILEENNETLGVSDILSFNSDPAIEEQTVSADETTIIVPFQVSLENREVDEARESINSILDDVEIEHYLTGEAFISQDIITNSEEGLKKTEIITVGLILVILFIVFKSFVAPFIPLLTVGISYLAAQGIVSILADKIDFPLSTFTQIFMVAIMFGIGTDYCILLISRFKEELSEGAPIKDAVLNTYKASGKTILFAGIAVLIGFSTIGLSTFSLYQSAVAVAVGVAVVMIALATLVPFFLVVFGKKLFWPFDKSVSHKESKLWGSVGTFAWARPTLALLIVAVIVVPALVSYDGDKSYNSLEEIGDSYKSVKGFNYISDSFGPGQTMPTTVVLESDNPIDTVEEFQQMERIAEALAKLNGVDQVRSATRPTGSIIEDFKVDRFTGQLADGIGKSTDGITEIQSGLQEASSELQKAGPQLEEAQDGVEQLLGGTEATKSGVQDIQSALQKIEDGIETGALGAGEIKENLQTIKDNLDQTIAGSKELLSGYQAIEEGLNNFGNGVSLDDNQMTQFDQLIEGLKGIRTQLDYVNPSDETKTVLSDAKSNLDNAILSAETGINDLKDKLSGLTSIKETLQTTVISPLNLLNDNLSKTISGQDQLSAGIGELIAGIEELENGLEQAAGGQGQVVSNIPSLRDGLSELYGGQEQLKTAFQEMQDQLGQLSSGLADGADGLQQIGDGLNEVQGYLSDIETDESNPIVMIPEEALENEAFMEGATMYLSEDKTIAKFDVVLEFNPYSTEALNMIDQIQNKVDETKHDTIFENSEALLGGISSTNNDLQNVSDEDYSRTVLYMIAGIFIILIILLRSIIMPIYLIGSLVLTYFTSMAFSEIIFVNIMGYDGLTWAVPFFAFVMLTALGIDYSIFLMDRFNEYRDGNLKEAMLTAMKKMGTVIISAAVILGGTFGAMLPSGVLSILQIATVVLIGLFLYAFVMLPLFIPIMVRLFGNANWWPFKQK
ncbi:MMPL family transporter [Paucisalibacillus globulus]|uniref:MMPL family transporter n=1 Tax=Paucisalibacillus globulus TaxID=351095 RepID=UPI000409CD1C|nr:MMPL family transporter [Paucisalibacillus globulus]